MDLGELKKSIWGYNKDSVCRYLVSLEENMSAKLEEKDREAAQTEEQLRARIAELEASLEEAREKQRQLTETQVDVKTEDCTKEEEPEKIPVEREQRAIQEIRVYVDKQVKKDKPVFEPKLFRRKPEKSEVGE